jgi:hypothetical protein
MLELLNLSFYLHFGSYSIEAADKETKISISDALYERLREIYSKTRKDDLVDILETEELVGNLFFELNKTVLELRADLIADLKSDNEYDAFTGEEYNYSNLEIGMYIAIPDDWD